MKLDFKLVPVVGIFIGVLSVGHAMHSNAVGAATHRADHHPATATRSTWRTVHKPHRHLRLAFITNNPSDFWTMARKGTELAQQELGNVSVNFRIPANGTAAEQKQIVDDLIAKGNDGMAISPKDPTNQVQMLNDAAKQTLVFTQDSDAPTSNRTCYVGTDNHAAGLQAGEEIKKALPNGGKIMLFVGSLDAQNAKDRHQGIMDALRGSRDSDHRIPAPTRPTRPRRSRTCRMRW